MPRIKLSHYVALLQELTAGQPPEVACRNFDGFLRLLVRNRQLDQIQEILRLFAAKNDQTQDRLTATVIAADVPSEHRQKIIRDFLIRHYQVADVRLEMTKDPDVAGLIIDIGDERYDLSLATQLTKFKRQLLFGVG